MDVIEFTNSHKIHLSISVPVKAEVNLKELDGALIVLRYLLDAAIGDGAEREYCACSSSGCWSTETCMIL